MVIASLSGLMLFSSFLNIKIYPSIGIEKHFEKKWSFTRVWIGQAFLLVFLFLFFYVLEQQLNIEQSGNTLNNLNTLNPVTNFSHLSNFNNVNNFSNSFVNLM